MIIQFFDIKNDNKSHLMKFGMDYYNDKTPCLAIPTKMFFKSDGIIDISIINQNASQNILLNSNYLTDNNDGTYNVALKHLTSKEGETVDLEVNHSIFTEDQIALFAPLYQLAYLVALMIPLEKKEKKHR
jgi:hypothetical protein